jgi:hypothetical protein
MAGLKAQIIAETSGDTPKLCRWSQTVKTVKHSDETKVDHKPRSDTTSWMQDVETNWGGKFQDVGGNPSILDPTAISGIPRKGHYINRREYITTVKSAGDTEKCKFKECSIKWWFEIEYKDGRLIHKDIGSGKAVCTAEVQK